MLWRALKQVQHGFYIDVGAWSPDSSSVTKAFYHRGWRGINIEPHPEYHRRLRVARPRDINLDVALGTDAGEVTMHFVGSTGLSTVDASQARKLAGEGHSVVEGQAPATTLAAIWAQHVGPDQPVHFLKVDVEGSERAVLLGGDWLTCRPWIVVVEATKPMTQEPSYDDWESILTGAAYALAYSDGLNRFYLADERAELRPAFAYPPNVFDEFVRSSEVESAAREVEAAAREAGAKAELAAIRATRSWRLTRPLREAARGARRTRKKMMRYRSGRARRAIRTRSIGFALKVLSVVRGNPALRRSAGPFKKVPGILPLYRRLNRISKQANAPKQPDTSDLSPRAQRFFQDLKASGDTGQAN